MGESRAKRPKTSKTRASAVAAAPEGGAAPRLAFQFRPTALPHPTTPDEAILALEDGNEQVRGFYRACKDIVEASDPSDGPTTDRRAAGDGATGASPRQEFLVELGPRQVGLAGPDPLGFPKQAPWALFLGCSDARVPSEMLFGQGFNDLFVVRVAGNVLGAESSASLIYALTHFAEPRDDGLPTLQLVVVLGHRGCGAVKAVVEHFKEQRASVEECMNRLGPSPVDQLIKRIYCPAFAEVASQYAEPWDADLGELVEKTVLANARLTAEAVARVIEAHEEHVPALSEVRAAYGVFDPLTFTVTSAGFTFPEDGRPLKSSLTKIPHPSPGKSPRP